MENHIFSISMNDFSADEKQFNVTGSKGQKMRFMLDSYCVYVDRDNGKIKVEEKWF